MKFERAGDSLECSWEYTQRNPGPPIIFIYQKDPRNRWQKIKHWYLSKFKGQTFPIYIDPDKYKRGWGFKK